MTKTILLSMLLAYGISFSAFAGEEEDPEWHNVDNIKLEISYMAKKLLDISGKDSYTVEMKGYLKPFIGICTSIVEKGIALTCVTPGTEAEKSGLKTGDIVMKMDDKAMESKIDLDKKKKLYFSVIKNMKTGDVIKMTVERAGETMDLDVGVGSLSHPGYTLVVTK